MSIPEFLELQTTTSMEGGINPLLCRVGSKKRFAHLLSFLAPEHSTYVEPFVGSGAFYWHKDPSTKEVVNDLDKDVAKTLRLIKKAPTNLALYPQHLDTVPKLKAFLKAHMGASTVPNELTKQVIVHCNGWMGKQVSKSLNVLRDSNPFNKLKHIAEYKARMRNTTVLSEDYVKVINKYNTKDTFFFLDPPYENSGGLGYAKGSAEFDFERLADALSKIKGKWLMTINDSPFIRGLFKPYHIAGVTIRGHKGTGKVSIGYNDRAELLVSNYPLPAGWKQQTGAHLTGKGNEASQVIEEWTPTPKEVWAEFKPVLEDRVDEMLGIEEIYRDEPKDVVYFAWATHPIHFRFSMPEVLDAMKYANDNHLLADRVFNYIYPAKQGEVRSARAAGKPRGKGVESSSTRVAPMSVDEISQLNAGRMIQDLVKDVSRMSDTSAIKEIDEAIMIAERWKAESLRSRDFSETGAITRKSLSLYITGAKAIRNNFTRVRRVAPPPPEADPEEVEEDIEAFVPPPPTVPPSDAIRRAYASRGFAAKGKPMRGGYDPSRVWRDVSRLYNNFVRNSHMLVTHDALELLVALAGGIRIDREMVLDAIRYADENGLLQEGGQYAGLIPYAPARASGKPPRVPRLPRGKKSLQ